LDEVGGDVSGRVAVHDLRRTQRTPREQKRKEKKRKEKKRKEKRRRTVWTSCQAMRGFMVRSK
jgi:hypothetical protein